MRQSIAEVLGLIREDLAVDMMLITIRVGDTMTVSRASTAAKQATNLSASKQTHDAPATPSVPGAFMAVLILSSGGERSGKLCCLISAPVLEPDRHHP